MYQNPPAGNILLIFGDLLEVRPALHEVVELCSQACLLAAELRESRVVGGVLLHLEAHDLELAFLAGDDPLDLCVLLLLAEAQFLLRGAFRAVPARGLLRFLFIARRLGRLGRSFGAGRLFLRFPGLVVAVAPAYMRRLPSGW